MEINSLSTHSFSNVNKAARSENVPESAERETAPDGDDLGSSAKVSVNKSQYGNEAKFAHQVFNKLNQSTVSNLNGIKSKISQGSYQNGGVNQAVISGLKNSL